MRRKTKASELEDEMRAEYDLSTMKLVGRGIYAKRFRSGTNVVLLDRDVREAFPDDESVNEVLRVIAKVAKRHASRVRKAKAATTRTRQQASHLRRAE